MRIILFVALFISTSAYASGYYASAAQGFARFESSAAYNNLKYQLSKVADSTSAPTTKNITVKASPSALKNLLALKKLTPAGFILPVALTAAGYAFDGLGNLLAPSTQTNPPPSNTGCTSVGSGSGSAYLMTNPHADVWPALCAVLDGIQIPSNGYYTCRTAGSTFANVSISITQDSTGAYYPNTAHCSNASVEPTYAEAPAQVISDTEFNTEIAPHLDWQDISTDTSTGQPISTPELTQAIQDTNNWYNSNYVDNSVSNTSTSTSTTIINQDGSETTTETGQEDIPAFCSWAGIMCDLANWFMEPLDTPEDVPVPFVDIEQPTGFTMPGGESCPAPVSITLIHGETMEYSYQPACDFMTMIRPFVLAIASFGAAFILLGAGRSS
jgi:hypothetical protein